MARTMKAAVLHAIKDVRVEETAVPVPGPDEVLVQVTANGLCHTDITIFEGLIPESSRRYPLILGHEAAGVVAEVGRSVKHLKVGDPVLLPPVYGCGTCPACLAGEDNLCPRSVMLGSSRDGCYAEYVSIPAAHAYKMSTSVDRTRACVAADAISTVYFALKERVGVKPHDRVAVFGAGGLGLAALAVAKALGAQSLYAVDVREGSLELAHKLGAEVINSQGKEKIFKTLKEMSHDGIRVAVDCVGLGNTIQEAFSTVRRGGEVAVIGFSGDEVKLKAGAFMGLQKRVGGSWGCPTRLFPEVVRLLESGQIPFGILVTQEFPLDRVTDAFQALHEGSIFGRAVVRIAD